MMLKVKG